ncbi:patatin-like phospholipase family protein [Hymenobacter montanus]|nr:patatin-like phospholipase family protein [Hymenobacter montanus]
MEGGGIRGIAYGGALRELEQQGILQGIERVGGTSAGAIQAALLAVGYSANEVIDVVNATPVQRLNDGRFIFFGGRHRLVKQYGWYRSDAFAAYLSELVARKTQKPNLTLGELHALA